MFSSRLFWKILLAATLANAACVAGLVAWLAGQQQQAAQSQAAESLLSLLAVAATMLETPTGAGDDPQQAADRLVDRLNATAIDRLVVLDERGGVLGDSAAAAAPPLAAPVGLANRPEVRTALAGRAEWRIQRLSPPSGRRLSAACPVGSYAAMADRQGAGAATTGRAVPAAVWGSLSLTELDAGVATRQRALLAAAAVTGLGFAAAIALLAGHVVRPVLALNDAADAIIRGDYQQGSYAPGADELGALARALNRIRNELGSQLNELREGSQRQATVLGGMIEGVIAVDDRERVLFANTAAGRLFGFIPPQIEGRPLLEVVRHHALHQAVSSGLSTARPQRLETEWEGAQERRTLLVQITPLPGDPCPGVVTVMHDTTELRRLESLRQDFVANVSHELKTPLSSIKAYTETLLDGAVNDKEHNLPFLRRIEEQADRLNNLIQDLLALARIESEQQPFEIQPVAVEELIRASLEDYRPQAESKQIILTCQPPANRVLAKADAEGLRVILNNLVDNAIKYTAAGGSVTVGWALGPQQTMRIDVTDTGIGIPAQELPRVFERFYRVDKARSRELGGTGLGLAIVKHLTHAFGGSVDVASRLGRGTTFTVELPAG